jgi:O-antigen ligase
MIAIAAALGVAAQFAAPRLRVTVLIGLIACGVLFQLNPDLFGKRFDKGDEGLLSDESATGHQAMWQVGLALAMDNPVLGVGSEKWEEVSMLYVDHVDLGDDDDRQAHAEGAVGKSSPHNDLLAYWGFFGVGGLLALLGLLWGITKNCLGATRATDLWIRGMAVAIIAGLAGYMGNALFHNVTTTTTLLWMYAGVSVPLARWAQAPGRLGPGETVAMWRPRPVGPVLSPRGPILRRRPVHRGGPWNPGVRDG